PVFRTHWSASPSRSRTQDTSRRWTTSHALAAPRFAASSGYRKGRRGISYEVIQKLLRNMVQGTVNRCFSQFRQRHSPIAVPCQLGIEGDSPEAWDPEARYLG